MRLTGQLVPRVIKKPAKSKKTRNVDIQIISTSCVLRTVKPTNRLWLQAVYGDYLPLFEEVMHSGKQLYVAAFSSGLNPAILYSVDEFIDLDRFFFEPIKS